MRCAVLAVLAWQASARSDQDLAVRRQLLNQIQAAIPTCEELCKKTNGYFPADSGLADPACRRCVPPGADPMSGSVNAKNCHEKYCGELALARGAGMCPNDGFMECVAANSAVPALIQQLSSVQNAISDYSKQLTQHETATRVALLQQIQSAIPTCEELCKKTNG